jgi:adenosine deaminase
MALTLQEMRKVELHQHLDGSIPLRTIWRLMKAHGLNPVPTLREMRRLLQLQPDEEGALLSYLDKFHYPLWITQFYENIQGVTHAIVEEAYAQGVRLLELRYAPAIHTYAGLTPRQAIRSVLSGMNQSLQRHADLRLGLIIISMRQHGPHIAKIIARQALAEAQHLHERTGVVGFDLAGAERGNPPHLYRDAYEIARRGGLGLTVHAGEDEGPERVWEAVDHLGADRIGHGCSAVRDRALLRRLARDQVLIECCPTSNYQTGAVPRGAPHPILTFLEHGIPVAVCTDNTTVSATDQIRENRLLQPHLSLRELAAIHRAAARHSFIRRGPAPAGRGRSRDRHPSNPVDSSGGPMVGSRPNIPLHPDAETAARIGGRIVTRRRPERSAASPAPGFAAVFDARSVRTPCTRLPGDGGAPAEKGEAPHPDLILPARHHMPLRA